MFIPIFLTTIGFEFWITIDLFLIKCSNIVYSTILHNIGRDYWETICRDGEDWKFRHSLDDFQNFQSFQNFLFSFQNLLKFWHALRRAIPLPCW